jgi:sigma54-dependent transcription regulator
MDAERKLLEKMARRNGGVLMIDDVIMEAADESSILHSHFEWDDTEAAISYRRDQARTLIQRCRITLLADEPTHVRAFVSLPSDRSTGGGYRLVADVMTDDSMKEEFIHDIKMTISRWTKKLHLIDSDIADLIVKLDYEIKQRSRAQEEARV